LDASATRTKRIHQKDFWATTVESETTDEKIRVTVSSVACLAACSQHAKKSFFSGTGAAPGRREKEPVF